MNETTEPADPRLMPTILLVFCVGAAVSMLTPLGFSLRSILCASVAALIGCGVILVLNHLVRRLSRFRARIFWRS